MLLAAAKNYERILPKNFLEKDRELFEKEFNFNLSAVNALYFKNIKVLSEQVLMHNLHQLKKIETRNTNTINIIKKISIFRKKNIYFPQAIYLTDTWSTNYFHWFTDALPRILLAEKHYPDIPVIIPAYFDQYGYIIESLKAFPKINIHWLHNYQKFKVKDLIYIPHTAPTGNYNEELIREVSNKLRNYFILKDIVANKKLMISRQAAPNRKITNIKEIKTVFQKASIKEVAFEKFSWQKQINMAAKLELLIGVHGAGLTNMLFMKPGTKLLEIRRKDDDKNNCYFSLASALNIDYYYLLCDVDDYTKITQENNFRVDKEVLGINIDKIIKDDGL